MTIALAMLLGVIQVQDAPTIPAFPEKWNHLTVAQTEKRAGAAIATLAGAPEGQSFSATGFTLLKPPADRELHLTIYLRRKQGQGLASINTFAYSDKKDLLNSSSKLVEFKNADWQKVEADLVAPLGSVSMAVWVINGAKEPLEISSPTMTMGGTRIVALTGSGILRASSQTVVGGGPGEVRFPVPSPYRDQAPISFKLASDVPNALKSWKLVKRINNDWICVANVDPPKDRPVHLRWESLVLIRRTTPAVLPKADFNPPPPEVNEWTRPSGVVQCDDPGVMAKAEEIKKDCTDVEQFARKVIEFTSQNHGTGQPFNSLDAKAALGCGGSCTSRANLAAALLRAGGVAARTVPHLPTWAYGSQLYEHWLTEYWHPGVGWVWLEPTMGKFQPEPSTLATLAVSTLMDERATGTDGQLEWIMPGAAYMSGIQGFGKLVPASRDGESDNNWCKPERRMEVSVDLFRAASAAWPDVIAPDYVKKIEIAASAGKTDDLKALLSRKAG